MTKLARLTEFANLGDLSVLTEVKLSRVYNHLTGERPVALITAFRNETADENRARNIELANTFRSAGFGFFWVDGAWIENKATDSEVHVSEVTLFLIGDETTEAKMFDLLVKSAQKYNQDGFIFKKFGNAPVALYDKLGNVQMQFRRVTMDKVADMYTKIRGGGHSGRSFVFESERNSPGFIGRLMGLVD